MTIETAVERNERRLNEIFKDTPLMADLEEHLRASKGYDSNAMSGFDLTPERCGEYEPEAVGNALTLLLEQKGYDCHNHKLESPTRYRIDFDEDDFVEGDHALNCFPI